MAGFPKNQAVVLEDEYTGRYAESIDVRLHNVEEKLSQGVSAVVEKAEGAASDREETDPAPKPVKEAAMPERIGLTAVGRSGRIYTEAELELQIRE